MKLQEVDMKIWVIYKRSIVFCKEYGISAFLASFGIRIYRVLFQNRVVVYSIDCTDIDVNVNLAIENITVSVYRCIDQIPISERRALYVNKGGKRLVEYLLKKNYQKGGSLWLVKLNDQVVGWRWTVIGGFNGFYYYPLRKRDAVFFDGEIFRAYRGLGISPAMLQLMFIKLKHEGIRQIFGDVKIWNEANLRSLPKAGLKKIGVAKKISLMKTKIVIWYGRPHEVSAS